MPRHRHQLKVTYDGWFYPDYLQFFCTKCDGVYMVPRLNFYMKMGIVVWM